MSFDAYISFDPDNKEERRFEYPYEQMAAIQIAKALWRAYNQSNLHCVLIANIIRPPIDIVILTQDGLGIIELKDYTGPVYGTENEPWFVYEDGETHYLNSGSHVNPFNQVRKYRKDLFWNLRGYLEAHPALFPNWKRDVEIHLQASVVFTAGKFDLKGIVIDPRARKPWFDICFLDEVTDWVYSLSFCPKDRNGRKTSDCKFVLSSRQMEQIAKDYFCVEPWETIENLLESEEPYGCLWMLRNGKKAWPLMLDQDEMHIGRSTTNSLCIAGCGYVSRVHALIRKAGHNVWITDLSKRGTWIDGKKLMNGQEYLLKDGNRLILGITEDGWHAGDNSCELMYEVLKKMPKIADPTL